MTTPDQPSPARVFLWIAGVLVALAGLQLFVFPERTDRYFAWTIDPPLTAVFLGASYWSSAVLEWSAARARTWAGARIALPGVFVFTVLTLGVTLLHLDRFHLGPELEMATRAVTWAWIAIYALVPVLMVLIFISQMQRRPSNPTRWLGLPRPVRLMVAAQCFLLLGVGVVLLAVPAWVGSWWPWELTPLTGRAIGAWAVSLGVVAGHAFVEDDTERVRPAALSYLAFVVLQAIALARYPGDFAWSSPVGWVYLLFLLSAALVGGVVVVRARVGS